MTRAGPRDDFRDRVAIVGVAESELGHLPHRTELQLHARAAKRALDDAGIAKSEVDGILSIGSARGVRFPSMQVAEYLGIVPSYSDSTSLGGCSFEAYVQHAAMAIAAGLCSVCLITYGSTQRTGGGSFGGGAEPWLPASQFEAPYGLPMMAGAYALAAQRHMHLYGTTREQLARVAVAARQWAAMNPLAFRREPITVEDVLASAPVSSPLHRLDCCLVTDGGGAVVVTSRERARDTAKAPVYLWGSAESHNQTSIGAMPELTVTPAAITGPRAFAGAGITPADIDVAQIYDSFTITVLMTLEDLGFCPKGEGGRFVGDGRIAPGGAFPMNTQGGGLSYTHPGMFGIFLITEAVRQLRGECGERQVAGARLALCHGTGGALSSGATLILGSEPR
ncbi:acetyl-CoA acetyltransferase [Azospirillum halopraeferens]|uniref:acetyl-CoA acetyltransferase n=1 Tax=Azospirillum halopraeferens TaxID=34010 RepID=UPI0003FF2D19|nr:acetyl-CoA acetyltransferase [Azospirillum halopraeferens]